MIEKDVGIALTRLDHKIAEITGSINTVIAAANTLQETTAKVDPTIPHQLILEKAAGGYVITIGRDGSRVICTNITDALIILADYCEETVTVNDKNNFDDEEEEEEK